MRSGLRSTQPKIAPFSRIASKRPNAAPACIAPSTVRAPSVTTNTSQKRLANGEKLLA